MPPNERLGDRDSVVPPAEVYALIVDDDPSALAALSQMFAREGYQTATASDGAQALALARQRTPDVVITDLAMPNMDGLELCRRLHAIDADLPVIVLTSTDQAVAGSECLRVGAEDYVAKPVDFETLVWSVQRALARRATKRDRDRQRLLSAALQEELVKVNERLILASLREQTLSESESLQRAQLNLLLERLSEGVMIADGQGHVQLVNRAARTILGLADPAVSDRAAMATHASEGEAASLSGAEGPLQRALRGEEFSDSEAVVVGGDGESRTVVSTGTFAKDAAGNVALAIVVFRDVTALRNLEQRREEYTALISHDLRNPLNVIAMSAQLLNQDLAARGLSDTLGLAQRIERNAGRMNQMIAELTEATSLESHAVELERKPCDLAELVARVVGRLEPTSAQRVSVQASLPSAYVVLGDAGRLERCIVNLVSNALKYSADEATVEIGFNAVDDDVELRIDDRGIGIAPDSLGKLFQRYYRSPGGKARAEGLGLGLYITRLIVEAHGGAITVHSKPGEGSSFVMRLPGFCASG